jgi:hypothetical protein
MYLHRILSVVAADEAEEDEAAEAEAAEAKANAVVDRANLSDKVNSHNNIKHVFSCHFLVFRANHYTALIDHHATQSSLHCRNN